MSFLTPPLAEFILALPEDYIVSCNGTSKAVFRQAMRGIGPDSILDRRGKLGFPAPERQWLTSAELSVKILERISYLLKSMRSAN